MRISWFSTLHSALRTPQLKKGFTLLELTAVAAVVSAVSLTAYNAVKKGKEAQCTNNLKQIHQALTMFMMDNGAFPSAKFFPDSSGDPHGIQNVLKQYGTAPDIFFCPSIPEELNMRGTNYIWNDAVRGKSADTVGGVTWLMTEMTAVSDRIPPPHTLGYNTLFADGTTRFGPRANTIKTAPPAPTRVEVTRVEKPVEPAPAGKELAALEVRVPSPVRTGVKVRVEVIFLDKEGALFAGAGGTLSVSASDPQASFPASLDVSPGGRTSFEAGFVAAGQQWLRVKASERGLEKRVELLVLPGGLDRFVVKDLPDSFVAGQPRRIAILAADKNGAKVTYGDNALLLDRSGSLSPEEITFTAGQWEGDVVFTRVVEGDELFVVKEGTLGTAAVTVEPAAPAGFVLTTPAEQCVAGTDCPVRVSVLDKYGNVCTGFEGELKVEVFGGRGVAESKVVLAKEDRGAKTVPLALTSAGRQKIRLVKDDLSGEKEVTVLPGLLDHFTLDAIKTQTAGVPFDVQVKAEDKWGNRVKGFVLKDLGGSARYVQEDPGAGMWIESAVINRAAKLNYLEVDDGKGHRGKSNLFEVVPAKGEKIMIEGFPADLLPNKAYPVKLVAKDGYDNVIEGYQAAPVITCTPEAKVVLAPGNTLPASVSVTFPAAGRYTIEAKDGSAASLKCKRTVLVLPAPAPTEADKNENRSGK